jgi:hypothetical protein
MATDTWTGVYGGNWSDPTGWSGGTVPAAGDTVQLSQALNGPYTVHLDANEGAYAALTVSTANATLALYYGGLTLSVTGRHDALCRRLDLFEQSGQQGRHLRYEMRWQRNDSTGDDPMNV